MKKGAPDHFWNAISNLLARSSREAGDFRFAVLSEIQEYSRTIANGSHMSDLFIRLCDIALDCQFSTLPEDVFKVVVATLLHDTGPSGSDLDGSLRNLTGLDPARLETAREYLSRKECLESELVSKITGVRRKKEPKKTVMGFAEEV